MELLVLLLLILVSGVFVLSEMRSFPRAGHACNSGVTKGARRRKRGAGVSAFARTFSLHHSDRDHGDLDPHRRVG
jgi:hypothetical protein